MLTKRVKEFLESTSAHGLPRTTASTKNERIFWVSICIGVYGMVFYVTGKIFYDYAKHETVSSIRNEAVWLDIHNSSVIASSSTFPRLVLCPRMLQLTSTTLINDFNVTVNTLNDQKLSAVEMVVGSDYVLLQNYIKKSAQMEIKMTTSFANRRICFQPTKGPSPSEYVVEWPESGGGGADDVIDIYVNFTAERSAELSSETAEPLQIRRNEGDVFFYFKDIQRLDNDASTNHSKTYPPSINKKQLVGGKLIPLYYDIGICLDACIANYWRKNIPQCAMRPQHFVGESFDTSKPEQCRGGGGGNQDGGGGGVYGNGGRRSGGSFRYGGRERRNEPLEFQNGKCARTSTSCFRVYKKEAGMKKFSDAKAYCNTNFGSLAVLKNDSEKLLLERLIKKTIDNPTGNSVIIGIENGRWIDGSSEVTIPTDVNFGAMKNGDIVPQDENSMREFACSKRSTGSNTCTCNEGTSPNPSTEGPPGVTTEVQPVLTTVEAVGFDCLKALREALPKMRCEETCKPSSFETTFNVDKKVKNDSACSGTSSNNGNRQRIFVSTRSRIQVITASARKTFLGVIAEVGGYLGLFVGISLVTMLEFFLFIVSLVLEALPSRESFFEKKQTTPEEMEETNIAKQHTLSHSQA